ncbi:MAG: hypothetical protein BWY96_01099 [Spirochaetes bacterium ADurb.BinA120]|nr:MAG: hypothetical protein BWY96_01099 [Spirochaetes bacterium ADurb.BinA120]
MGTSASSSSMVMVSATASGAPACASRRTVTPAGAGESSRPSKAVTVKASTSPDAPGGGTHSRLSPKFSVVRPPITGKPPLVSQPVVTDSMTKLTASPSPSSTRAAALSMS